MKFKEVAHLYKGVPMQTEMGVFPLICYHDGQWMLDTIAYGANAVEQDIRPILRPLSDISSHEKMASFRFLTKDLDTWVGGAKRTQYLLSKHFDLFGLIESGEALDSTKIETP